MKEDICDFGNRFLADNSTFTPVDKLWTSFKQTCLQIMNTPAPSEMTATRYNQPWSNSHPQDSKKEEKKSETHRTD
ncbi:MAG: hypothetical protein AB2693_15910 [Candidatus Thiodiazotropha sp.]